MYIRPVYTERIVDDLLAAAAADPAAIRLLFHHAAREPDFRAEVDRCRGEMVAITEQQLTALIPDPGWRRWAAHLAPHATVAAITAWLDAGRPDPATAADRVRRVLTGIVVAAAER